MLHADFGLKGAGGEQKSTISVTLGEVTEKTKMENAHLSRDVLIDPGQTSIFITSPLFSTAAGGGNNKSGHAGYFVLENFEPKDVKKQGGIEKPLGDEPDQRYALLRLATATSSLSEGDLGTRTENDEDHPLRGFAAGLAEFGERGGIGIQAIDSGKLLGNVVLETAPASNRG